MLIPYSYEEKTVTKYLWTQNLFFFLTKVHKRGLKTGNPQALPIIPILYKIYLLS